MSFQQMQQLKLGISDPNSNDYDPSNDDDNKQNPNNVVYEHNGNTITVQSTKVIGEYNYSFVSVSPT